MHLTLRNRYYKDILHDREHIQYWGVQGWYCKRLSEWAESKVRIMIRLPWVTHLHTEWVTHSTYVHSLCHVVEGAEIHKNLYRRPKKEKKHLIVYSTEVHNFEPLGKDKALIGALCNVIIPSLFMITKINSLGAIYHLIYTPEYLVLWEFGAIGRRRKRI